MHPVLFKLPFFGGIPVYAYGVLVACAFLMAIFWVGYDAKRSGLDAKRATDLVFYIILTGILGSRIAYIVLTVWDNFVANPIIFFKLWEGGLVWYGGLVAAFIVAVFYVRHYKLPVLAYIDCFAPAVALGHAIGRLGCVMAGCCFGKPIGHDAWYAMIFPADVGSFAPPGVALYPTQLMEAGAELVTFAILLVVRHYKKFSGQVVATYLILYGVARFVIEFFRGDMDRGFVIPDVISVSQLVSIFMIVAGCFFYIRFFKGTRAEG